MSKIFEALHKGQRESLELVEIRCEEPAAVAVETRAGGREIGAGGQAGTGAGGQGPGAGDEAVRLAAATESAPEALTAAPVAMPAAPMTPPAAPAKTPASAPAVPATLVGPVATPVARVATPVAPVPTPAVPMTTSAAPATPAAPVAMPAALAKTPAPPAKAPAAAAMAIDSPAAPPRIRTLPLHLAAQSPVLPFDGGQARASEQYRIARTRILQDPHAPRIILLSSPGPRDGKTTTAINLAGALSLRAGFNVLLVDGDFRRSTVHTALGLPAGPGLAEVLSGTCALEEALIHVEEFPNLYVLPAGHCQGNPAELLDSAQWVALQATLKRRFRSVVIDSPPIAAVADYELLLAGAEGVILVVRVDHTSRKAALNAIETLPKEKFMGVLLNCVEPWFLGKGQSYSDAYYYEKPAVG